jgi:hypothetical protein
MLQMLQSTYKLFTALPSCAFFQEHVRHVGCAPLEELVLILVQQAVTQHDLLCSPLTGYHIHHARKS